MRDATQHRRTVARSAHLLLHAAASAATATASKLGRGLVGFPLPPHYNSARLKQQGARRCDGEPLGSAALVSALLLSP
jgi:BarA-like signal transduction histidine kinase